jgi:hypothetical protein
MMKLLLAALLLFQVASVPRGQTGTLSGRVLDGAGRPAAGVRVSAVQESDTSVQSSIGQTDNSGQYRLENVPAGRYYIASGFVNSPTYYPGVSGVSAATAVSVTAGADLSGLNFSVGQGLGVSVRGHVSGVENLSEAARKLLTISMDRLNGRASIEVDSAEVDAKGNFEITRVPPGTYSLGILPNVRSVSRQRISVDAKDVEGIRFDAPNVIAGKIQLEDGGGLPSWPQMGPQYEKAIVYPVGYCDLDRPFSAVVLKRDGSFGMAIPDGDCSIQFRGMMVGYYVKSITYGTTDLSRGRFKFAPGSQSEIRIMLTANRPPGARAGVKVQGRITGIPADGSLGPAFLWFQLPGPDTGLFYQDVMEYSADGTFEFSNVMPGTWSLYVAGDRFVSSAPTLNIGSRDITGIELRARAAFDVSGRVTLARSDGQSLSDILNLGNVNLELVRSDSVVTSIPVETDGEFTGRLGEGEYTGSLIRSVSPRGTLQVLNRFTLKAISLNGRNVPVNPLKIDRTLPRALNMSVTAELP